jgi:hypothetical protein
MRKSTSCPSKIHWFIFHVHCTALYVTQKKIQSQTNVMKRLYIKVYSKVQRHSFSSLPYEGTVVSSKVSSPQNAIYCFLFLVSLKLSTTCSRLLPRISLTFVLCVFPSKRVSEGTCVYVCGVWLRSRILDNEKPLAHCRLLRHDKMKIVGLR